ncbi:Uncharacterized protein Adt_10538 [Abeliophyllum distichum]|uniref:Transposase n=1 Tax=Abeliophyllum distichum TaxID=126358 RepID=A0ABD1UKC7_9LAMI
MRVCAPPKLQSISRVINLEKVWQANGKMSLPIAFDNVERTMQHIENNAKYFTRLVGNQVRFTVPPCYPLWTESYFDLQGDRSPDEYRAVCAAVDRLATNCYRDYKLKAHNHLKAHGPSRPYGEMSAEDLQKCIDFFTSPTFMERSTKNKVNRGKAKYPSVQGSKNFSVTRYDERDPETQQWLGIIDSSWTFHTFRDGNWVNPQAAGDYDKLVELRETQHTQVASSGAPLDERTIVKEVLGERRGHVRGVRRVPGFEGHLSLPRFDCCIKGPTRNFPSVL